MLSVHPVPAFTDNYLWVLHDGRHAAVVDPGDAKPVLDYLAAQGLLLTAILCTHHHADHTGGVAALREAAGDIPVYGPAGERIPARTVALREGDRVALAAPAVTFSVLDVPGHTAGHIAYVGAGWLFCGDTLFGCGCGRLFEGTADEMAASLAKLAALPGETRVCCAHEYTLSNIRFAEVVEPGNAELRLRKAHATARRKRGLPTLPSTIALERATNPFLRGHVPAVAARSAEHAGHALPGPVEVFAHLRQWKDHF